MIRTATTFFLVLLLALGLRVAGITYDSFWLDEGYQTMVDAIGQPLPDFTQVPDKPYLFQFGEPQPVERLLAQFRQVDPLCPPLHAVLLNRWMTVFGTGDAAVRALSVVFSLAALAVVYWCVYILFGARAALFTGLAQALSPFDIFYAQEARMYSLLVLAAAGSFGALLLVSRRVELALAGDTKRPPFDTISVGLWTMHAIFAWAMINTHYTGLFVFMAEICFGLWAAFSLRRWSFLVGCIVSWLAVAALWAPWLPLFFQAAKLRTASFYVVRDPGHWWWPAYALVRIAVNWIVFLSGKKVAWFAFPVYATSAVLLLGSVFASLKLRRLLTGPALPLTGVWLWLLVPPAVLLVMDILEAHRVVEIPRYVMATAPAVYVLAGLALSWLSNVSSRATTAFLALHCVFALLSNLSAHVSFQREPWRETAQAVEKIAAPDDLVLVAQHYDVVCLNRYLTRPLLQVGISPPMGAAHLSAVVGNRMRFILITAQEGESIKHLIPVQYRETSRVDWPHGLHLRVFTRVGDRQ